MAKEIIEPELTEEESKSIEDFDNQERGVIIKSKNCNRWNSKNKERRQQG